MGPGAGEGVGQAVSAWLFPRVRRSGDRADPLSQFGHKIVRGRSITPRAPLHGLPQITGKGIEAEQCFGVILTGEPENLFARSQQARIEDLRKKRTSS